MDSRSWTPASWRSKPIKQAVEYEDQASFQKAVQELGRMPPLVTPQEIVKLKNELREVALGNAFLLQGGDCAELFDYCNQDMIESKIKLLLQMSLVVIYAARKKVVRIARMAGQYAKPRSSPTEVVDGVEMPSFRGDILNSYEPNLEARNPDPHRLVKAYQFSSATLNYLRASLASGLADLHAPLDWSLGHVRDPALRNKYQQIVSRITDTLDMMRAIGIDKNTDIYSADIFSSHEGLLLEYETALTRLCNHPSNVQAHAIPSLSSHQHVNGTPSKSSTRNTGLPTQHATPQPPTSGYYNTSAHFLWIGDRTRQLNHAHVEYFRGIANPIGVKLGPSMPATDIVPLLDILNPTHEIGKIVLITRYGADKIAAHLPAHIQAVQNSAHAGTVVWQCDPMHGNGRNATVSLPHSTNNDAGSTGAAQTSNTATFKTRRFSDILTELRLALSIHRAQGSYLGGVHLELTGEPVTECVGGAEGLTEQDLRLNYTTFCDPRLNEKQALELAFLVAGFYRDDGGAGTNTDAIDDGDRDEVSAPHHSGKGNAAANVIKTWA